MTLERRLQVLLDEERHRRLASLAAERGVSVASVVREAIDRGLPGTEGQRRGAARRILDAPDMEVPDTPELLAELDALRAGRG